MQIASRQDDCDVRNEQDLYCEKDLGKLYNQRIKLGSVERPYKTIKRTNAEFRRLQMESQMGVFQLANTVTSYDSDNYHRQSSKFIRGIPKV